MPAPSLGSGLLHREVFCRPNKGCKKWGRSALLPPVSTGSSSSGPQASLQRKPPASQCISTPRSRREYRVRVQDAPCSVLFSCFAIFLPSAVSTFKCRGCAKSLARSARRGPPPMQGHKQGLQRGGVQRGRVQADSGALTRRQGLQSTRSAINTAKNTNAAINVHLRTTKPMRLKCCWPVPT